MSPTVLIASHSHTAVVGVMPRRLELALMIDRSSLCLPKA